MARLAAAVKERLLQRAATMARLHLLETTQFSKLVVREILQAQRRRSKRRRT
jgi:hypothetical protein